LTAQLLFARDIRRLEARAERSRAGPPLMERAGRATAELAARLAADTGAAIVIVAGPGNNGGDAWVAADCLRETFHRVTVLDAGPGEPTAPEAKAARQRFLAAGGTVVREWPGAVRPALVVDGLLGIGLARNVEGALAGLIDRINSQDAPVLAIDVPSGLDADTGAVRGVAVRAAHTLTFLGRKPGLFTGEGLDCAGTVHLDTLGVEPDDPSLHGSLTTPESVRGWLAPRARNVHKGSFGTLGVIGGARGMVGAALLAARAGLRSGAGKVYVGLLSPDAPALDPAAPELMLRPVDDALHADVLVVGPGAGVSPSDTSLTAFDRAHLPAAIASAKPLVLDADALNAVATQPGLQAALAARQAPTLLTPHPGEAARLLGTTTTAIQDDRVGAALGLARRYHAEVVVKGAGSVCAGADGAWSINSTGSAGLASGGTGDALAGLIGALLCQGLPARRALAYAVCLHGAAAEACVASGEGPAGLTASDVIEEARRLLNSWVKGGEKGLRPL
jgi:hydroxyethylthiazole kinase-like uncharacterized protein yjeF